MHSSAILRTPDNENQNFKPVPPALPTLQSKEVYPIGVPAVVEIPRLPFSQHFTYNVAPHIESSAFQPSHSKGHSIGASAGPERESYELSKNEIRSSSNTLKCISAHVPRDHIWLNKGHNVGAVESLSESDNTSAATVGSLHVIEMTDSSGCYFPHAEKNSHDIECNLMHSSVQPSGNQRFPLEDESKLTTRHANPLIGGKLWEGSLQLSTSTIVSAVAFFRSGERASEIQWAQYIEVKGKVRLEAFERYIQELPRSRSRALMVTSLCWNAGSSKTGLTCMKEIAKVYKGQKVGYAQLSPGTDLYVCPRSETVFTILAKYGFFKGMVAVEEDQDSLIGCVVWRRNLATSHAKAMGSKKSLKNKPSHFPTKESGRQLAELTSTIAIPNEHEISQTTERSEDDNTIKPCPTPPLVLSVPENKFAPILNSSMDFTTVVDPMNNTSLNSFLTATEIPVIYDDTFSPIVSPARVLTYPSRSTNPDSDANAQQPLLEVVENCQEAKINSSDDDDLPEFDFVAACGAASSALNREISLSAEQASLVVMQYSKKLHVEQSDSLHEASKSSEKIPSFKVSKYPSMLPVLDHSSIQAKVKQISEKTAGQTTEALNKFVTEIKNDAAATKGLNYHIQKKNLDDSDDEDMPEWCPPEMDIGNPSSPALKVSHHSFHPPSRGYPENQPPPFPLGLSRISQLHHQQSSEDYRERLTMSPPEPSRLTDYHLPSVHGFSWQSPASSKHPSSIDPRKDQTPTRHMPSFPQTSQNSPPRSPSYQNRSHTMQKDWSPSSQDRFQSIPKHNNMSLSGRKYALDYRDCRNSRASGKLPRNQHGRSPGNLDRYHYKHQNHNEKPGECYTDLDVQSDDESFSPRHKPIESSRRRPSGFDILPNAPRRAGDQYPRRGDQYRRRRPSLFDVQPGDRSNQCSW